MEAEDEAVFTVLLATAEAWLRERGITRVIGPISMSIWEEPGLLIEGYDHPPTVMMGHAKPAYSGRIERAGFAAVKELLRSEEHTSELQSLMRISYAVF